MKINRVEGASSISRGEQMNKKKTKSEAPRSDKVVISPEALAKLGARRLKPAAPVDADATTPMQLSQIVDTAAPSRANSETPVRTEKIEHAKSMIQNRGYDNPEVLEAIIQKLVFALKE